MWKIRAHEIKSKAKYFKYSHKNNFTDDYKRKLTEVIRLPGMINVLIRGDVHCYKC